MSEETANRASKLFDPHKKDLSSVMSRSKRGKLTIHGGIRPTNSLTPQKIRIPSTESSSCPRNDSNLSKFDLRNNTSRSIDLTEDQLSSKNYNESRISDSEYDFPHIRSISHEHSIQSKIEESKMRRQRLANLNDTKHLHLSKYGSDRYLHFEPSSRISDDKDQVDSNIKPESDLELQVKDCFGRSIDLESNSLNKPPVVFLELKSFYKLPDKKTFRTSYNNNYTLQVSDNEKFIVIGNKDSLVDDFVVNIENQLKKLSFGEDSLVMELKDNKSCIIASHHGRDEDLRDYFKFKPNEKISHNMTLSSSALKKVTCRASSPAGLPLKDKEESDSDSNYDTKNKIFEISPARRTRVRKPPTRYSDEVRNSPNVIDLIDDENKDYSIFKENDFVPFEEPAKFYPELIYKFPDGKTFRISFHDFRTLYNNDWINDNIIDFCIRYDIEQAIEHKLVERGKIFAFNTFFYPKLKSKTNSDDKGPPNYYKNIQRWVSKIDLMSYDSIVIPVNENLHWFCCVIKGLPKLLKLALDQKSNNEMVETEHFNSSKKVVAEIFVFDSLSAKRESVKEPLKRFIIDYCQDKHDVEIQKDQIRVIHAKVPRQNNFNDCGIHVIYNVKKWLNNMPECETFWRKHQSTNARAIFKAEERNVERKTWINRLLELHKKQFTRADVESELKIHTFEEDSNEVDNEEDDVIELPQRKNELHQIEKVTKANEDISEDKEKSSEKYKTLDPLAKDTSQVFKNEFMNISFGKLNLSENIISTLNELFPERSLCISRDVLAEIERYIKQVNENDIPERLAKERFVKCLANRQENGNNKDARPKVRDFKIKDVSNGVKRMTIEPGNFFNKINTTSGKITEEKDQQHTSHDSKEDETKKDMNCIQKKIIPDTGNDNDVFDFRSNRITDQFAKGRKDVEHHSNPNLDLINISDDDDLNNDNDKSTYNNSNGNNDNGDDEVIMTANSMTKAKQPEADVKVSEVFTEEIDQMDRKLALKNLLNLSPVSTPKKEESVDSLKAIKRRKLK